MIDVTISDELIEKLAPSKPQVVHAHWIKGTPTHIECSNCGFWLRVSKSVIPKMVYCPHCGTKMYEEWKVWHETN